MSASKQKSIMGGVRFTRSQTLLFDHLFCSQTVEEFLSILHKKMASQFRTGSFVFCWNSGHFGLLQCIKSGKNRIYRKRSQVHWPQLKKIRVKNREDSQYLANELGRPFQNIISLPILTCRSGVNHRVCLFIEVFAKNLEGLLAFCESHIKFFQACVDRLLLEEHLRTSSNLWMATFNGLNEPLAIMDENNSISNANNIFTDFSLKGDILEKKILQKKGRTFKRDRYSVSLKKTNYSIYYYSDVTESLSLRSQMVHNEKMVAIGKLGETLAHKLNNPLTGVLSMVQWLLHSKELKTSMTGDMKAIAEGILRSQKIISNLLDFSSSNGQLQICNLNVITQNTLPFLKSITYSSQVSVHFSKEPVFVKVQPCLLQQVIFNLVKNACQAVSCLPSFDGKVSLRVFCSETEAILCVEDNGKGVELVHESSIFKPFFTTKQKEKGTGLGLSISRTIVERFDGSLKLSAPSSGGACFTLRLPLKTHSTEKNCAEL